MKSQKDFNEGVWVGLKNYGVSDKWQYYDDGNFFDLDQENTLFSVKNLKNYRQDGREKCVFANPVSEMFEIDDCVTGQHLGSCEIEGA